MKKTIVITGASSGFGRLLVEDLLAKGHTVIATMRSLESRRASFKIHPELHLLELDLLSAADRENLVKTIQEKFHHKLDVLINNAGFGVYGALEDASDELIDLQMNTNLNGQAKLTRDLLPFLRESGGQIFFFSSIMGLVSMPLSSLYSASKFAIEGLAQGLRYELAPFGVQVCTVCPGRHRTDFAKNIQWTNDQGSAYSKFYQGLKGMMKKFSEGKEIPASNVVDKVVEAIQQDSNKARLIIGSDARGLNLLQKVLPHGLYLALTRRIFLKGMYR